MDAGARIVMVFFSISVMTLAKMMFVITTVIIVDTFYM